MQRQHAFPWRVLAAMGKLLHVRNATDVDRATGVDGDAWYSTDYVYPNRWPYSEQKAVPLPMTKRRHALRENLKSKFDGDLFVGLIIAAVLAALYVYLRTPLLAGPI